MIKSFCVLIICLIADISLAQPHFNKTFLGYEAFKPHMGIGLSYRYPGPAALEVSFKPLHWIEFKTDIGYSIQKFGYNKLSESKGYFGGVGLFFSTVDRWQMQSSDNKFGFIWGIMYGQGKMDYSTTIRYSGDVFDDRFESLKSTNISYEYADFKVGLEFIIMSKLSIQVFPIQLGGWYDVRNETFPIKRTPAVWENQIRPGMTLQYKFNALK
ncbi:MAG: hypothetical protein ACI8SE_000286 [Bacteroidia bacterium]|jgi:hypothetical protein